MNRTATKQKGMVLVFLAGTVFLLFAVAALGVDVAYAYLQKNKLQNAVDAAAIAGTTTIYHTREFKYSEFPTGVYPANTYFPNPNSDSWAAIARRRVKEALQLNGALGYLKQDSDIEVNWYQSINPSASYNAPAVRISLTAPTSLFFARAVGFDAFNIKVRATSITPFPKAAQSSLPLTVANCAADLGWNFGTREPKLDPATLRPLKFQFGTASPSTKCMLNGQPVSGATGMWTDFTANADANNVGKFIPTASSPNPPSIPLITEPPRTIQVTTGVQAVNYMAIGACTNSSTFNCTYSVMPVLNSGTAGLTTTGDAKGVYGIKGFICVGINGYNLAGGAYIDGQFSTGCRVPTSGAGGDEFYGVIASSTLVD